MFLKRLASAKSFRHFLFSMFFKGLHVWHRYTHIQRYLFVIQSALNWMMSEKSERKTKKYTIKNQQNFDKNTYHMQLEILLKMQFNRHWEDESCEKFLKMWKKLRWYMVPTRGSWKAESKEESKGQWYKGKFQAISTCNSSSSEKTASYLSHRILSVHTEFIFDESQNVQNEQHSKIIAISWMQSNIWYFVP